MNQFITIIHPNAYQVNERLQTMLLTTFNERKKIDSHRYNNLEMGSYGEKLSSNGQRTLWAMIDGHIQNADALRQELTKEGFSFTTDSDSEVVIAAYDFWQEACLKKLSGPFALFLFNQEKKELLIARDPLGQKSLYWSVQGEYFLISTQMKTLLATGILSQTPALDALATFLYFGFIPQDLTPIKNVNKLLPGHYLKVDLKRKWQIEQFWSLGTHFEKKESITEKEAYDQLNALLGKMLSEHKKEARHLLFSHSLGTQSILSYLSHQLSNHHFSALSSSFPNTNIVKNDPLSLKHIHCTINSKEIFDNLPSIVWNLETPIADPNICLTYALSKEAEKLHIKHLFADFGFEEAFGGSMRPFFPINRPRSLIQKFASLPESIRNPLITLMNKLFGIRTILPILRALEINEPLLNYLESIALFKESSRKKVAPSLFSYFDPKVFIKRFHHLSSIKGKYSPFLYFDAKTLLPDSTLLQNERLFSEKNIKIEAPFLQHELVGFLASLPDAIKFQGDRPAAMAQNLLHMPYISGNSNDFFDNFQKDPLFKKHFELLTKGRVVEAGYISLKWLKQQLHPNASTFKELWAILIFEIWFNLYIHCPIGSQSPKVSVEELLT